MNVEFFVHLMKNSLVIVARQFEFRQLFLHLFILKKITIVTAVTVVAVIEFIMTGAISRFILKKRLNIKI